MCMDTHGTYNSLSTLRNLLNDLEKQMVEKHHRMSAIKNEFLFIQRQYKDIQRIINFLEIEKEKSDDR